MENPRGKKEAHKYFQLESNFSFCAPAPPIDVSRGIFPNQLNLE